MITVINALSIDDSNTVQVINNTGDIKKASFSLRGNSNLIQDINISDIKITTTVFGGVKQKIHFKIPKNALLFNSICSPDESSKALKLLSDFIKQVPIPVINDPEKVLQTTRDGVAQKLSSLKGVIMPKCIKVFPASTKEIVEIIQEEKFPLPFIFRTSCDHGSRNMVKIDSFDDLAGLERFAFNGENAFYMIEYVDYKSDDGYYRKMRYWVVGDKVIPRHLVIATSWNISYDIKKEMMGNKQELQKEEKQFLQNNNQDNIKKCLEIKNALNLDYFGIDCNVDKNGKMLIFEATPCMGLLDDTDFSYTSSAFRRIHKATEDLIRKKGSLFKLLNG